LARIAAPVEIEVWLPEVGAEFLIERTGRSEDRSSAVKLSEALGGLPLAHEQAAAYCERLGISLSEYETRFAATPGKYLDDARAAPKQYHSGLTVSKTFALAIDEAAKFHPAAEYLIVYAGLLAPEPIPLFLFSEAREVFGKSFASALADDGLDEAIAALRAFALVDRESIPDERDRLVTTDCIRLHRLVREIAAARRDDVDRDGAFRELIEALAKVYPRQVFNDSLSWPRARRLDELMMALVDTNKAVPKGLEAMVAGLLGGLDGYRHAALADYSEARRLSQRALAINEEIFGPDHPSTATALSNLGLLLRDQGDLVGARRYYERALAIRETAFGLDHLDVSNSLNHLGNLLRIERDLAGAKQRFERAIAIRERALGPEHLSTAIVLNNLAVTLEEMGDFAAARQMCDRALRIRQSVLGLDHLDTANSLNNLASLLQHQGDLAGAEENYRRVLAIREKVLGRDHPDTATALNNLGSLLWAKGDQAGARLSFDRALEIVVRIFGVAHDTTRSVARNYALFLDVLGHEGEADMLRNKHGIRDEN
jgi:tetratricopeptide (TPR) repeat protein